jgi:hypothetical protein
MQRSDHQGSVFPPRRQQLHGRDEQMAAVSLMYSLYSYSLSYSLQTH